MLRDRIDQFVKKINAPIICKFDDLEMTFEDGDTLAAYEFEKNYDIVCVSVEDGKVVVELKEHSAPNINSIGNEKVSGTDWIEEHKKL